MKKQVKRLALVLAFVTTSIGFAQETKSSDDTRDKLKLGLKAGVNFSNVYDEQGQDFVAQGKVGFVGGGFLSIPFGKIIGFQPEVMYSQKGFKATGSFLGSNYDYTRTTSFLDIPLLLQIKPAPMLTLVAGPQFSYLLETKNNFNGSTTSTQEAGINSQNYKKNIYGFVVGADLNFDNLVLSGRAGWDINQSDADGNTTSPRYKNQVIQLTLGYTF
ncbi:porin family protein [Flavobacterium sp. SUN052]|uniref:porin family protein n=1 Tax=Flavobacterium sp. SUN052 TaxID=3002441 RepID=UPI00237E19CA|nr:porin family protein [Flavobacterium sp. SUN052]MEC4005727.1 porin family protein [Flavobacterium sp. SUN052]